MEGARHPDAAPVAPALFLLDAGALRGPGAAAAACATRLWTLPAHHLDTPERLLACYQLICARRPEARVLVFLEGGGYSRLCLEWQGGACRALEPSAAQCVPFGCRVGDFLLEFAMRKAAEGCEVVVVSNVADIVMECRSAGPRISHLGFMFVEGEILLPGLSAVPRARDQVSEAAPAALAPAEQLEAAAANAAAPGPLAHAARLAPPVRRTISKSGSGGLSALSRRRQPPGGCNALRAPPPLPGAGRARAAAVTRPTARAEEEDAEEREETLRDSQLDGVALDDDVADTLVDEADDAFADTVVDLPYRQAEPLYDEAFADTLVDVAGDAPMATSAAASADGGQPRRLEDAPAVATLQDAPMAPEAEVSTVAAAPPAELPPLVLEDGDLEVDGEPEHQSQLPELQSSSSPEMEVEVEEHPSSPRHAPAAAAAPSQPRGHGSQASQTIVRPCASAEGLSQTIEIDAGAPPAAPAGPSRPAPADAGAGLARQATTTVLLPETAAAPAEPAPEAAMEASAREAAAAAAEAATAPMEVEVATAPAAPVPAAAAAAAPCAAEAAAEAAAAAPAHGSQGPAGAAEGGARRPAEAQEEAAVEVAGSLDTAALAASQAATLPARASQAAREDRQLPASALLGRWVRDGGREHTVVWTPGPAGSYLEFRPLESNKKTLPILLEGGSWVLNGFHLDASRSSSGLLHWANRATGAERSWLRPEVAGGGGGGGGAAAAVAALAGSFAGEAGS